jgi:predicted metal-dependent phosphoesterase TrpH
VRIDLHTHSRVSDGTQSPTELVHAAVAAGLDVLALTDHDTAEGWAEASTAALATGLTLVPGMEISTRHGGRSLHLLAYLPDPTHPALAEQLRRIGEGRTSRVPAMVERLRAQGIDITDDDVRRAAGVTASSGRPHVADALVTLGVVADRTEAFTRFLNPGRPGHAKRWAPTAPEAVEAVAAAGGASVVAHPWGRHDRGTLTPDDLAHLAELGLAGIEVDHQDHTPDQRSELRALARDLDLVATGSSDHHGLGKVDHDLGCHTTDPEEYARLLERAAAAAAAAGVRTPEVVGA